MDWKNRTYCGELGPEHAGQSVLLMGWVDAIRDHGNLVFIHLRDVRGIVQVVFDPQITGQGYQEAARLKEEDVIQVKGKVEIREKGTENPYLSTGTIEVYATELEIFSKSKPLPFHISEKAMVFGEELQSSPERVDEELRMKYRYLDLRRPSRQLILLKRDRIVHSAREVLRSYNFVEIETPFLTRSTPEGARDYLVPSRVHKGKFYALPQSPQLFKQLLMIGGMDRYYQIVRCFRDEDLRPNRQPEFTQLDLEASFIDEEFIYEIVEQLLASMFAIGDISLPTPFPRITYDEAMDLYGTDRPDTRFGMRFKEVTDIVRNTSYAIFQNIISQGGVVKGFCVRGKANELSKNVLQNEYAMKIVPSFGAKGMTWMKVIDGKLQSNIVQFFAHKEQQRLLERFEAREGDVLFMIADVSKNLVNEVLGKLRLHLAERLGLIPSGQYMPLWVTHFPLFEMKEDGIGSQHHPFTQPEREDFDPDNLDELLALKSRAYDIVINGEELGGGSIRIHRMETQRKVFKALGLSDSEAEAKFGFFLKALDYGAPPHGGLALGMDRVISMIIGTESIRDVIAFPKNRRAYCPLTEAPASVDPQQLEELGIKIAVESTDLGSEYREKGESRTVLEKREPRVKREDVLHVAKLARLKIPEDELDEYANDLNSILDYVEKLSELDTANIPPTSHVLPLKNVWRPDKAMQSKDADGVLKEAPERMDNFFKVPRILES
ncbi:MAG: Asp-tRNA(Asn)/Glu-tRNA(Gln) amidotransferase GatCAB subunit C [Deltaproteobacteria bacterium]|nr:MAG: Asp-tRNA(Asn)/Glu-tRNA(Gln) amidotransferase GatCAB subunit C [Deltaproteobacteria bacterium]